MADDVVRLISKPSSERESVEVDRCISYMVKKCSVLQNLKKEAVHEILRCCEYEKHEKDTVIILQGDRAECFYIIVTGEASVYIDTSKADEDALDDKEKEAAENRHERELALDEIDSLLGKNTAEKRKLDRALLGKWVMRAESGASFGEVALLFENSERTASVVADTETEVLVVQRNLFNRTIKVAQEAVYLEKRKFVNTHPLFAGCGSKSRKLLEISVQKACYNFDHVIVQQGAPVAGLYFIIRGQAKAATNPAAHELQYPKYFDYGRKNKKRQLVQPAIEVRRKRGYAAAEKRLSNRDQVVGHFSDGEMFGGLEIAFQLPTVMWTVTCQSAVELFFLNTRSYERIMFKKSWKSNEQLLRLSVPRLLHLTESQAGSGVPLLQHLRDAHEQSLGKPVRKEQQKPRDKDDEEFLTAHLLSLFVAGEAPLLRPALRDSIFFKFKSKQARKRILSARERSVERPSPEAEAERPSRTKSASSSSYYGGTLAQGTPSGASSSAPSKVTAVAAADDYPVGSQGASFRRVGFQAGAEGRGTYVRTGDQTSSAATTSASSFLQRGSESPYGVTAHAVPSGVSLDSDATNYEEERLAQTGSGGTDLQERLQRKLEWHRASSHPQVRRPMSAPYGCVSRTDDSDPESFDLETGDEALSALEERLRAFYVKVTKSPAVAAHSVVSLRRFDLQSGPMVPLPGGTVLVRRRPCKYAFSTADGVPQTEEDGATHSHVKRFILPKRSRSVLS